MLPRFLETAFTRLYPREVRWGDRARTCDLYCPGPLHEASCTMIKAPPETAPWLHLAVRNESIRLVRVLVGSDGIDPDDDNVDLEMVFVDGHVVHATLITPRNIQTLLARWKVSGEYGGGVALRIPDMLVLPDLSPASIVAAVERHEAVFGDLLRRRRDSGP